MLRGTRWLMTWSMLFLMAGVLAGCANQSPLVGKLDRYSFPVEPGTAAWRQIGSRQQMLDAVQIPPDRLAAMSTAGLIETVLDYPLVADIYVHNSLDQGLQAVKRDFNGLRTLLARPDAGAALLQRYRITPADAAREQQDSVERSNYATRLMYLELILAQPEISAMLTSEERQLLIETATQQQQAKEKLGELYAGNGIAATALVAERTLQWTRTSP